MKTVNIWGEEITTCGQCVYRAENNYHDSYCLKIEGNSDISNDMRFKSIHPNCPFLQPIKDMKEIKHHRFTHLRELFVNNKLYQIQRYVNGIYRIDEFSQKNNCWVAERVFDNLIIHNELHLRFLLKSFGINE